MSSLNKERQKFAAWSSDRSSADYVCVMMITNLKLGRNLFQQEGNGVRVCVGVAQMVKTADFPSEFSAVVECLWIRLYLGARSYFFDLPICRMYRRLSPGLRKPSSRWMDRMYTFLFTIFERDDTLSEHFLRTRQIVSTWTMHVALSACTRV